MRSIARTRSLVYMQVSGRSATDGSPMHIPYARPDHRGYVGQSFSLVVAICIGLARLLPNSCTTARCQRLDFAQCVEYTKTDPPHFLLCSPPLPSPTTSLSDSL